MLKSTYTAAQLGIALARTVLKHKKELEKPIYPEKKVAWIKQTADKIFELLEVETRAFNNLSSDNLLKANDLISVAQTVLNRLLKALGIQAIQKD